MATWEETVRKNLGSTDVDGLLAHLGKANHVTRPGQRWRTAVREMIDSPELLATMLKPLTPKGGCRPEKAEGPLVFGTLWATLEVASPALQELIAELVPWCQKELGVSHQAAYVGVHVLGLHQGAAARATLERFRVDPTLKSLLPGIKAALRKHGSPNV